MVVLKMLRPDPFQIEIFGEELAKLNAMPLDDRRAYVAQRQQSFNTPDDLVQKAGFPTEYWENMEEIPQELLDIQQRTDKFGRKGRQKTQKRNASTGITS